MEARVSDILHSAQSLSSLPSVLSQSFSPELASIKEEIGLQSSAIAYMSHRIDEEIQEFVGRLGKQWEGVRERVDEELREIEEEMREKEMEWKEWSKKASGERKEFGRWVEQADTVLSDFESRIKSLRLLRSSLRPRLQSQLSLLSSSLTTLIEYSQTQIQCFESSFITAIADLTARTEKEFEDIERLLMECEKEAMDGVEKASTNVFPEI